MVDEIIHIGLRQYLTLKDHANELISALLSITSLLVTTQTKFPVVETDNSKIGCNEM